MVETSRRLILWVPIVAAWCALCGLFSAAEAASTKKEPRIALDGYDPVAYFTDGRPVKGSQEFTFAFDDAVYYFKSAEHRAMFAADPDRYAPQYSVYCTISVSMGKKVHADPEAWIISDGEAFRLRRQGWGAAVRAGFGRDCEAGGRRMADGPQQPIGQSAGQSPAFPSPEAILA
jgi:hypothetical protein